MVERRCSRCKERKFVNKFSKNRYQRDGLSSWCKKCHNEYIREWQKNNPEKFIFSPNRIYATIKYSIKKRKKQTLLCSLQEFINWYNSQEKKCSYCDISEPLISKLEWGRDPIRVKFRLEIDRKDNNKGYLQENMTLACHICNNIKRNILTFKEMREIGQKYIKPKWEKLI